MKPLFMRMNSIAVLTWLLSLTSDLTRISAPSYYLGLIALVAQVLFFRFFPIRLAAAAAVLWCHHLIFDSGVMGNSHHGWALAALPLIFLSGEGLTFSSRDRTAIRCAQALLLAPYFLSGIWRFLSLAHIKSIHDAAAAVLDFPAEMMAYTVAEGNGPSPAVWAWLAGSPYILFAGFTAVWAFEIFSVVPVLRPRFTMAFGVFAALFHLSMGVVFSVWFTPMILSALFYLVAAEVFLKLDPAAE